MESTGRLMLYPGFPGNLERRRERMSTYDVIREEELKKWVKEKIEPLQLSWIESEKGIYDLVIEDFGEHREFIKEFATKEDLKELDKADWEFSNEIADEIGADLAKDRQESWNGPGQFYHSPDNNRELIWFSFEESDIPTLQKYLDITIK